MKRAFDVVMVVLAAPFWIPVLIVLALFVRLRLGSPILFAQHRPGLHGKPFTIVKFRTMTDARGPNGELLPDAVRLTPFGSWLRATSLDELPELWNVLKGEMSLVGPRPLLTEYLPLYTVEQARRHEAVPGITGWAQINGRNAINWDEKFALDVWYVDHRSMRLDATILCLTFWRVIKRDGISAANEPTMPRFVGAPANRRVDKEHEC